MVLELEKRLSDRLRSVLKEKYDLEISSIPLETPPDLILGEIATPIAFELARKLRKAPKIIAQEIVSALAAELDSLRGFAKFEVAGAGYINAYLDRAAAAQLVAPVDAHSPSHQGHVLVEHTSINPNKAAHIGHLRNAILGDTFVRLLRAAGYKVDVQNYIDNTGVQVADVVVGFLHLEKKSPAEVRALLAELARKGERIDYYCWDLYAKVSRWYGAEDFSRKAETIQEARERVAAEFWPKKAKVANERKISILRNLSKNQRLTVLGEASSEFSASPEEMIRQRKQIRLDTLHAIEHGGNDTAEIADLISTAVLRRHLETMLRLGIEYDFLPRESEILRLKFWEAAFEKLKQSGVLYFENEGKNKGCWVMSRAGSPADSTPNEDAPKNPDEDAKVIVRSNGTVTYVGKDIAYHLWKFGLLGKDFGYNRFFTYPDHECLVRECWISAESGEVDHPHFGGASAIYNVIDARQSDPQSNVIQALRGMGYTEQADHYTHFSYEMVALTPRCAIELGYNVSEEDQKKSYIEVSGRKGFGVKADNLIDKLTAATRAEVDSRKTSNDEATRQKIAEQIAIGALRYFMLKVTRNSVIAFDFRDALSFEGETGPYIQYAVVRIRNIFRKGNTTPNAVLADFANLPAASLGSYLSGDENEDIWSLWLRAGRRTQILEQCIATSEPAHLARHAFQLAQEFANFYHRHHILTEVDPARKTFLLATAAIALRELVGSLALLGIESPEAM